MLWNTHSKGLKQSEAVSILTVCSFDLVLLVGYLCAFSYYFFIYWEGKCVQERLTLSPNYDEKIAANTWHKYKTGLKYSYVTT